MPVITYTDADDRRRHALVPPGKLNDWIARKEARGSRINEIQFSPDERAHIVLATTSDNPVAELDMMRDDLAMSRVTEDLFNALKNKGVLVDDDLPSAARQKIVKRNSQREAFKCSTFG